MARHLIVEDKPMMGRHISRKILNTVHGASCAGLGGVLIWGTLLGTPAQAELVPESAPSQIRALFENPPSSVLFTAETPSERGLTIPSLWLAVDQFGGKMVRTWRAYPPNRLGERQIHMIVRPELWNRYTYLERYGFLSRLSTAASRYGYNLLLLDRQNFLLGGFACNFAELQPQYISQAHDFQDQPIPNYLGLFVASEPKPDCQLWIRPSLQIRRF